MIGDRRGFTRPSVDSRHEDPLVHEERVVRARIGVLVGTAVVDDYLGELPDRAHALLDRAGHERVGGRLDRAERADRRIRSRGARNCRGEWDVLGGGAGVTGERSGSVVLSVMRRVVLTCASPGWSERSLFRTSETETVSFTSASSAGVEGLPTMVLWRTHAVEFALWPFRPATTPGRRRRPDRS
jgi:hypothetical protein